MEEKPKKPATKKKKVGNSKKGADSKTENLQVKQELFVRAYVNNGYNATQAALTAGYSEKTAAAIGFENLRKPKIQSKIKELLENTFEKQDITRERIIAELATCAFSDIRNAVDWRDGKVTLVDAKDVDEATARAIQMVQETETARSYKRSLKLHDKLKALELLGRGIGMWDGSEDDDTKGGGSSLSDILKSVREVYGE